MTRLVHPRKFEDEIGQPAEVREDGEDHPWLVLPASPESCHQQDKDRDRNSGDCEPFLGVGESGDDDEELYCKAQEKEEIKFQKSNVYLTMLLAFAYYDH